MGLPVSSLANLAMWFAKVSIIYGIGIRGQQENYKFLAQTPEKANYTNQYNFNAGHTSLSANTRKHSAKLPKHPHRAVLPIRQNHNNKNSTL